MNRLIDLAIFGYQRVISPVLRGLGCSCRFHPTCSTYAREVIRIHPWGRAVALIAWRLARCGPWHPGGVEEIQ